MNTRKFILWMSCSSVISVTKNLFTNLLGVSMKIVTQVKNLSNAEFALKYLRTGAAEADMRELTQVFKNCFQNMP